ncbi:MAG: hypothetical protein RL077_2118 [Verrucomicrobiota bacterium]|jgi:hypothetical protein
MATSSFIAARRGSGAGLLKSTHPGEWVGLAAKIPKKIAELTLPLSADWPANSDQRARTHPDDDPGKPRQTTHSAFRRSGREKKADDSYELLGKNRS